VVREAAMKVTEEAVQILGGNRIFANIPWRSGCEMQKFLRFGKVPLKFKGLSFPERLQAVKPLRASYYFMFNLHHIQASEVDMLLL
jgi:hypothetical protein